MLFYIYLLECNDGAYYVGVTNNLNRRLKEHQAGISSGCFTNSRQPVRLKNYRVFENINEAIKVEKKLKRWSKAKKEAYFKRDWKALHDLSSCKNPSSHKNHNT